MVNDSTPFECVKSLLIHVLLATVKDAQICAEKGKKSDAIEEWLYSPRFEFWVEMLDIDCEVARDALLSILDGKLTFQQRTGMKRMGAWR